MPAIKLNYSAPMGTDEIANANSIKTLLDQVPCLVFDEIHEESRNSWVIYHFVGRPNAKLKYLFTRPGSMPTVTMQLFNGATEIRLLFYQIDVSSQIFTVNIIASSTGIVIDNHIYNTNTAFAACLNSQSEWVFYDINYGHAWDGTIFADYTLTNIFYPSIDNKGNYLLVPIRLIQGGSISEVLPGNAYSVYAFAGDRSFLDLGDGIHKAYYKSNKIFII